MRSFRGSSPLGSSDGEIGQVSELKAKVKYCLRPVALAD